MKMSEEFPSVYFRGSDLPNDGTRTWVTVSEVSSKNFARDGAKPDKKVTLAFEEDDRTLSMNVTQRKFMIVTFGDDSDDWIGKMIGMYPFPSSYEGKPCISIALVEKKAKPAAKPSRTPVAAVAAVVSEADASEAGAEDIPF